MIDIRIQARRKLQYHAEVLIYRVHALRSLIKYPLRSQKTSVWVRTILRRRIPSDSAFETHPLGTRFSEY